MATSTSSIYINVIEDVINKLRDEFVDNGPGEDVLKELQGMWEAKMMQAGAVTGPIERSAPSKPTPGGPITPVHDLNVPYEDATTDSNSNPLPGTADNAMYNVPTGPSDHSASGTDASPAATTPGGSGNNNVEVRSGRPTPYMTSTFFFQQPPSWMGQRTPVDVNIAYVEGREEAADRGAAGAHPSLTQRKRDDFASQYQANGFIPQQDGAGDAANSVFEIEVARLGSVRLQDNLECHIHNEVVWAFGSSVIFKTRIHGITFYRMLSVYCDQSLTLLSGVLLQISGCNSSDGRPGAITSAKSATSSHIERSLLKIPQLDGPMPDPYDDVLSTPNKSGIRSMSSYKDVRSHRMLFDRQSLVELGTRHKLIMDVMKAGIDSQSLNQATHEYHAPIRYEHHMLTNTTVLSIYNYQGVFNEDYNIANTPAPNDPPAGTPAVVTQDDVNEEEEDSEPSLNEDDDDDDLDDVDQGEELSTQHLVLAQFDKVTRTKSRWKCTLKDGIMHINNKDILFNKATGEFDF
ncbi:hypothetical protein Csa_017710 [Cucumis sativus]|nr:hypothetical protein Csa_017710 [Cucumis sativus]